MKINSIFLNSKPCYCARNRNVHPKFKGIPFDVFEQKNVAKRTGSAILEDGSEFKLSANIKGHILELERSCNNPQQILWHETMEINLQTGELESKLTHKIPSGDEFKFGYTIDKNNGIVFNKQDEKSIETIDKNSIKFSNKDSFELSAEKDTTALGGTSHVITGSYFDSEGNLIWTDEIRYNTKTGEVDIQTQSAQGENITHVVFHRNNKGNIESKGAIF